MQRRAWKANWFRLILITLLGYFLYTGISQYVQLNTIVKEQAAVGHELEQARQLNARLQEEHRRLHDRVYIEKLARDQLGLTKPGETLYIPAIKQ